MEKAQLSMEYILILAGAILITIAVGIAIKTALHEETPSIQMSGSKVFSGMIIKAAFDCSQCDNRFVNVIGDIMKGDLNMNWHDILNVNSMNANLIKSNKAEFNDLKSTKGNITYLTSSEGSIDTLKSKKICLNSDCRTSWPKSISCSDCDPRFVNVTGDTITGNLNISGTLTASRICLNGDCITSWSDIKSTSVTYYYSTTYYSSSYSSGGYYSSSSASQRCPYIYTDLITTASNCYESIYNKLSSNKSSFTPEDFQCINTVDSLLNKFEQNGCYNSVDSEYINDVKNLLSQLKSVNNSLNSLINEIVNKIKEYFWLDDAINKAETEEERNRLEEEQRRVLQEIVNKIKEYFSIEDTLDSILSQLNELKDKLF